MQSFFQKFKSNFDKQGFPTISFSLILGFSVLKFKGNNFLKKEEIPKLPKKETKKPTILVDYNILVKTKFPFFIPTRRKYTDEFLFHLCQLYELISITNIPHLSSQEVDPYGCISYHYFLPDKTSLKKINLNRDSLICITKNKDSLNKDFCKNILEIKEDFQNEKLFSILDFFNNLYFTRKQNWEKTIDSYKGKDFFSEFNSVYKKLFYQKNSLKFGADFEKEKELINQQRILEFNQAKIIMDGNIRKNEYLESGKSNLLEVLKGLVSLVL